METLELPVMEEQEEETPWQEHEIDLAAYQLWREASRLGSTLDDESPAAEQ
jgi:hypothetical protein